MQNYRKWNLNLIEQRWRTALDPSGPQNREAVPAESSLWLTYTIFNVQTTELLAAIWIVFWWASGSFWQPGQSRSEEIRTQSYKGQQISRELLRRTSLVGSFSRTALSSNVFSCLHYLCSRFIYPWSCQHYPPRWQRLQPVWWGQNALLPHRWRHQRLR